MFKLVGMQLLLAGVCMLFGFLFAGSRGAVSAGLGGLICTLPTLVCVLYLTHSAHRPGGARAFDVFVGEAIKVALALAILLIVKVQYPGMLWPAMIAGLIVTLQANYLALLVKT